MKKTAIKILRHVKEKSSTLREIADSTGISIQTVRSTVSHLPHYFDADDKFVYSLTLEGRGALRAHTPPFSNSGVPSRSINRFEGRYTQPSCYQRNQGHPDIKSRGYLC